MVSRSSSSFLYNILTVLGLENASQNSFISMFHWHTPIFWHQVRILNNISFMSNYWSTGKWHTNQNLFYIYWKKKIAFASLIYHEVWVVSLHFGNVLLLKDVLRTKVWIRWQIYFYSVRFAQLNKLCLFTCPSPTLSMSHFVKYNRFRDCTNIKSHERCLILAQNKVLRTGCKPWK